MSLLPPPMLDGIDKIAEWRDAREAILLVAWGDPAIAKANTHLWTRLGHAEAALMAWARTEISPRTNQTGEPS